jgi:hypothetical protein
MKEGSLFCFCHTDISQAITARHAALLVSLESSPKPSWCVMPHSWYLGKALPNHHSASCHTLGILGKLSMSTGALTWFWDCLELRCGSFWLLNHFLNEN